MEAQHVSAERGWGWYGNGWRFFMRNPGIWILLVVIYMAISVVLGLIPLLGGLINALLGPALFGGLLYGCARLEAGEPLEVAHLFQAFRDSGRTGPMLVLGAITLAGALLALLLGGGLMFGGMYGTHMMGEGGPAMSAGALSGLGLLGLLVILAINLVVAMALFYATPLVMLEGMAPVDAMKTSISGCLRNIVPLLLFGILFIVLAFLAAIPLALGFLVLIPVGVGAVYQSYREVYPGRPAAPQAAPQVPPPPPRQE